MEGAVIRSVLLITFAVILTPLAASPILATLGLLVLAAWAGSGVP
jgi:hypothetical protein